jgi:hypothetical protein
MQQCAQTTTCALDKKCVTRYRSTIISESRLQHATLNGFRSTGLDITQDSTLVLYASTLSNLNK